MASLSKRADGNWQLRFVDAAGNRPTINLGKSRNFRSGCAPWTRKELQPIQTRIERLIEASITGNACDRQTALWLRELADDPWGRRLLDKLADRQLVPRREVRSTLLIEFVDQYIAAGRTVDGRNAKPGTVTVWKRCRTHLHRFFGEDVDLRAVTIGDAKDFRRDLLEGDQASERKSLAEDTVRRTCGIARQFFADALERKLIESNPFDHRDIPTATGAGDGERREFITRELADKVLGILPDAQWKLMFALSRFGGLRCPSEVLSLTWGDIDFEAGRIVVTSPKTAHHKGKGSRTIPLFDELRPYLQAVLDEREAELESADVAVPMTEPVITRYHRMDSNYGVLLGKLVTRAGLKMWPKPFHNLRASRETELAEHFPQHVVCAWIGNSPRVAQAHYLQVTDDHFAAAVGPRTAARTASANRVLSDNSGDDRQPSEVRQAKTPQKSGVCRSLPETAGHLNGRYRT